MPSTAEPYKQVVFFFLVENSPKIQLKFKTGAVIAVAASHTYSAFKEPCHHKNVHFLPFLMGFQSRTTKWQSGNTVQGNPHLMFIDLSDFFI
jgi:hypothetical protein